MESKNFINTRNFLATTKGYIEGKVYAVIVAILGVVILVLLISAFWGPLSTALDNLSASGIPLGFLYGASGILGLIFAVVVFLALFKMIFSIMGKGSRK